MTTRPDPKLESIAEAVADETPVDWDDALAETPAAASTLGNLRVLAALARASRRGEDAEASFSAHAAPADPASGALFRWGPLAALEPLGSGSFGEVYRAWDPALRREVALKLRRVSAGAGSDRRWLDEARRLARVRHPNVLVVHGADVHDGRAGLWTDLLQGATLEDLLSARGTFGSREAALVGVELCGALAAVHAAGLVHGDVKTGNVMREGEPGAADGSGRIVLMDFGSAHDAGPGAPGDGASFGTPLAIAPEVLAGASATPASDLYALGVLLFRLVTGRYPIDAKTVSELADKQARGERAALRTIRPDLPAPFVAAVEKAIESDPRTRFADAAGMERALVATLAPTATVAAAPRAVAAGKGRTFAFAAAAVAIAVVVTIAVLALGRGWRGGGDDASNASSRAAASAPPASSTAPGATPPAAGDGAREATAVVAPPVVDADLVRGEADLGEPLSSGDLIAPGDRIALELRASEPVHAYVLSEDDTGALFVLFPLRDQGAKNPLASGKRHRLPGKAGDASLDWVVTTAGGRETFLLLAARAPLASVEDAVAQLPAARADQPVRYAPLPPRALDGLRAVGGVAPRASEESTPGRGAHRLAALAKALDASPEGRAVWRKLVLLENPAP